MLFSSRDVQRICTLSTLFLHARAWRFAASSSRYWAKCGYFTHSSRCWVGEDNNNRPQQACGARVAAATSVVRLATTSMGPVHWSESVQDKIASIRNVLGENHGHAADGLQVEHVSRDELLITLAAILKLFSTTRSNTCTRIAGQFYYEVPHAAVNFNVRSTTCTMVAVLLYSI